MGLFDDISFEINCPECDTEITVSMKQMGTSVVCPKCKVSIDLQDDGIGEGLNNVEKSLNDLSKGF